MKPGALLSGTLERNEHEKNETSCFGGWVHIADHAAMFVCDDSAQSGGIR
jgi:hypothetical protein